ncbi:hypothetical protein AMTRI_Chr10g3410 [Amborella trichopoda]
MNTLTSITPRRPRHKIPKILWLYSLYLCTFCLACLATMLSVTHPFKAPLKIASSIASHPPLINDPCSPPFIIVITPLHPPLLPTPIPNNPEVSSPLPHLLPPHLITFLQTTPKRLYLLILPQSPHYFSTHPNIPTATCPNHLLLPPLPLSTPIAYPAPNHSPYIPNEQQDQNALIPYQGNTTLVPFACTPLPQSPNSPQFNPPRLSIVPPLQSSFKELHCYTSPSNMLCR